MKLYYVLTRKGSDEIIEFGSKETICNKWGELKYQIAPDEEYSVRIINIEFGQTLTKSMIEEMIQECYDRNHTYEE